MQTQTNTSAELHFFALNTAKAKVIKILEKLIIREARLGIDTAETADLIHKFNADKEFSCSMTLAELEESLYSITYYYKTLGK
jgi:hypothetical protein